MVDLKKCVGCQTCTIACKLDNGTPPNVFWRLVRDVEVGSYPNVRRFFLPLQCMHCANPPCMDVCPTTATKKRDDGIVYIDYSLCVGCAYCIQACPYEARWLVKERRWYFGDTPTKPELLQDYTEKIGLCTKCDFCMDRIDYGIRNGKRPGADPEATPVCVNACIAGALVFGDLDDPESEASRLVRSRQAFKLLPEMGTDPSVYYLW